MSVKSKGIGKLRRVDLFIKFFVKIFIPAIKRIFNVLVNQLLYLVIGKFAQSLMFLS